MPLVPLDIVEDLEYPTYHETWDLGTVPRDNRRETIHFLYLKAAIKYKEVIFTRYVYIPNTDFFVLIIAKKVYFKITTASIPDSVTESAQSLGKPQ